MKLNCKCQNSKNFERVRKLRFQTRAQVTIAMIVGIIILIGIISFFIVRQVTIDQSLRSDIFEKQEVPEEITPLIDYVENCITDVAAEGLILLGERGGFIDPIASGFISNNDATESSAVSFAKNWKIPYWYYLASANQEKSYSFVAIPGKSLFLTKEEGPISIEGQLENFLSSRIEQCINFNSFEEQGFKITPKADPSARVLIAQEDIVFAIDYPLKIEKGSSVDVSNFFVRIPLNINKIFEMATLITYLEQNFHFLENHALNIIAAYSGTDKLIPPIAATEFSMNQKTWDRNDVEERVKEALQLNINRLSVSGTANYKEYSFPSNKFKEDMYNKDFSLSADESVYTPLYGSFSDLSVYFDYLPAELYFDVNCDPICKPESASSNWLSLIGMQRYNTIYDLSFPVKIEITEPVSNKALFGKDYYSFNFMLETNIRSNDPLNASTIIIEPLIIQSSITFEEQQRTSADVTINVKDSLTKQPISDVKLMYTCIDETGYMGETKQGIYVGKFPICLGGILTFVKEGYIQYSVPLTTDLDQGKTVSIDLAPKVDKTIVVKKALMQKTLSGNIIQFVPVESTFSNPIELSSKERATVTIVKTGSINEEEYVNFVEIKDNQESKMSLAPGTYDVDVRIFYDEQFVIPAKTVNGEEIQEVIIEDGLVNGGLVCKFIIGEEELAKSSKITFFAVSPDLPNISENERDTSDLVEIAKIEDEYSQYCNQLRPRLE